MFAVKTLLTTGLVAAALGFAGAGVASAHEGYDTQGNYVGTYAPTNTYNPQYAPRYAPQQQYAAPQYAPQYSPIRAPDNCGPAYYPPRPVIVYPAPVYRPYYCPPPVYRPYYGGHDRFRLNVRW